MQEYFILKIFSLDKTIYEGQASSLVAPSSGGYLGVEAQHAPLIASLIPGEITFENALGQKELWHNAGRGFIEVSREGVTLLVHKVRKSDAQQ